MPVQLEGWLEYIGNWPELKSKCIGDYLDTEFDWKEIGKTVVFPQLDTNWVKITEAYENILAVKDDLHNNYQEVFGYTPDLYLVLYFGLGNSAGWVTSYNEKPAILLGLDKIAELGWQEESTIKALLAHELCHVANSIFRREDIDKTFENPGDEAIWRLYIEGFAQRYQGLLCNKEYHQDQDGWLSWCKTNHHRLARNYLDCIRQNKTYRDFYGDWYNIDRRNDTGYYLGCEFIKSLEGKFTIAEIATLTIGKIKKLIQQYLKT